MRPSPPAMRARTASRRKAASLLRVARIVAILGALLGALVAPGATILAHAELDVPTPADGATVTGTPPVIGATYTETLDADGSSLVLVDASGAEIARGGVVTTAEPTKEMSIPDLPELAPGAYTVKSTTKSAADGDVDRKTWTFTVVAAASPSPSPTPSPVCTDQCAGQSSPTAPPSATPVASSTTAAPSATPGSATPAPSDTGGSGSGTGTDVLLPIVAGLAIVGAVAIALARRRGRTAPPA